MIAGTLEIQMLANLARLSKDMSDAKTMVGSTMKGIESSVGLAKKALGALGVGLSVNWFAGMITGAIDAQDRLYDLSKTTRISVEDLSGLKLAAKQSGSDLESIAQSINKLGQNMGANQGKFKALGITAKDPIEAFKQLSDILNMLDDTALRNATAAAALGKSWQGAAPLLAAGSVEIQKMIDRGKVLSGQTTEQAKAADALKDKYAELQIQMESGWKKVANSMLPGIADIIEAVSKAAEETGGWTAALVAFGGAIKFAFGQTLAQQSVARLREIGDEMAALQKSISTGRLQATGFWSFLFPDVKLGQKEIDAAKKALKALEEERKNILGIKDQPKPEAGDADAHVRAFKTKLAADFARKQDAALQEEKIFIAAMQRLEKEFFSLTHEGQVAATMYETMHGSLKGLTDEHKALLIAKAQEIDAYKREEQARAVVIQGLNAENAARSRAIEISHMAAVANAEQLDQMRFEHSLIGVSRREVEQLNAQRAIDLKLRQDIAALPTDEEGNLLAGGEQEMARLRRQADIQRQQVRQNISLRQEEERTFITGAKNFFNEYADIVSDTATMTHDAFSNAFRGIEDGLIQLVKTGKLDFKSLADSIISDILRIQIRQNITGPLAQAASKALGSVFSFADGGIMTSSGPVPLRRYAVGGVADSAQLAMFGEGSQPEAFVPLPDGRNIPVKMQGGGGGAVRITVAPVFNVSAIDSRGVAQYLASKECQRAILGAVNAAMLRGGNAGIA